MLCFRFSALGLPVVGSLSSGFAKGLVIQNPTLIVLSVYPLVASSVAFPIALFGHCGSKSFGPCPADSAVDDLQCFRKTSYLFRGCVYLWLAFRGEEYLISAYP